MAVAMDCAISVRYNSDRCRGLLILSAGNSALIIGFSRDQLRGFQELPGISSKNYRAFLNLWFAKPMASMRGAFHENDGNHENNENDEADSDSYKQGVE